MQNMQNTANHQASPATQQVSNTVNDNVDAAFAKTRVLLQAAAPTTSTPGATTATASAALTDFKDYMSKTPEQRMRDSVLKEMGITEDDVKNMSPEKQLAIGKEIAQRVEDKMKLAQADKENSATGKQVPDTFLAAL
jgi:hypothetical protein